MKKILSLYILLLMFILIGCSENSSDKKIKMKEQNLYEKEDKINVSKKVEKKESDEEEKYNALASEELFKNDEQIFIMLSKSEKKRIKKAIKEYYSSINQKIIHLVQIKQESSLESIYKEYSFDEIVLFEVSVENSEAKRYITVGSNDNWNICNILNEGY